MALALTASLYLTVVLRFLLPLPASSPNLGSAVELGGTASRVASELGERLGRGRSGVRIGKWANRGGGDAKSSFCKVPWLSWPNLTRSNPTPASVLVKEKQQQW